MEKIKMQNPIVEIDGDEMTRILWAMIKEELILPFVDLNTEYYDLCLPNRDATDDQVTVQAAEAIKHWHVGVKCATITPNLQRMEEYHLKKMWKSPNATIRAALDGTVFRAPILISKVKPVVSCWKKPITIARHAYGDIYKAVEYRVPGPGKAEMVFTDEGGKELSRQTIFDFKGPGVLQGMHNRDDSILSFARCCFTYALEVGQDVWFSSKDTISKDYDQTFKLLFQKVYEEEFLLVLPGNEEGEGEEARRRAASRLPVLIYNGQSADREMILKFTDSLPFPAFERYAVESSRTMMGLASLGEGWTVVPPGNIWQGRDYVPELWLHRIPGAPIVRPQYVIAKEGIYSRLAEDLASQFTEILEKEIRPRFSALNPILSDAIRQP